MDWWVSFWSGLTSFIANHGLLTVAILVLIKSAGLPLPVPADLLVVFVGAQARTGAVGLGLAWLILSAATVFGATLLYGVARWIGPDDIVHYGHYLGLNQHRLEAAEAELRRRGQRAIVLARIVPGLRLAIVVACGILGISRQSFFVAVSLAALAYVGVCLALGYVFGQPLIDWFNQLVFPVGLIMPSIALGVLLVWLVQTRRSLPHGRSDLPRASRVRAGAVAGVLAAAGSLMLADVLLYIGGPVVAALLSIPPDMSAALVNIDFWPLLGAIMVIVLQGVVWGAAYGAAERRWLPAAADWTRGLAFAGWQLAVSLLVLISTLASSGAPGAVFAAALIGEIVHSAAYGTFLGLIYPIFRAHRAAVAGMAPTPARSDAATSPRGR
jgi:membrane protein DedA with SNARE-associated domain